MSEETNQGAPTPAPSPAQQDDKAWIREAREELKRTFADGFQVYDLVACAEIALRHASKVEALGEDDLVEAGALLVNEFIDATDTPWLPDSLSDPIMKMLVPNILRSIVKAARGGLSYLSNKPKAITTPAA